LFLYSHKYLYTTDKLFISGEILSATTQNLGICFFCTENSKYDNGQNAENRMLVFYSPDNLGRLANAQTFFMDGTLSVAPHPCKQLYTIRVPFKDVAVTAVYAFLPNKCRITGTVGCW
jgi:hypothetical protein